MSNNTSIKCPDCGKEIDVNDILKHQIEDGLRKEFLKEKEALLKTQQQKSDELAKAQADFEDKKKRENELFQERLKKEKKTAEREIELKLRAKLEEDSKESLKAMQDELAEKSEKVKDLLKKEAEIEKLKREKGEATEQAKLEAQKELNKRLAEEREKIKRQADEGSELKMKELQKQLEDQKKLTEEMKRKQEQGSMQLQGEVMELAIEEWLANQFPLDTINEIKKGATGADCLQVVNTREQLNCGTIYYESKRTKAFQPAWIEKFKNDIRLKNATIGVLVTEVMPKEMDRMGLKEGIWICTFDEFKALCFVLRDSIIRVNNVSITQANKGDKMSLLYDYLTGTEFKMQIEAIKDAFMEMQTDLNREMTQTQTRWNRRQKQIDKVIMNTTGMYGSLKGIAGSSVPYIEGLDEDDEDLRLLEE